MPRPHLTGTFLSCSLRRTCCSFHSSPKPPPPFIPSLYLLRKAARKKDEEIDERLHPRRPTLPASLPPEDEAVVEAFLRKPGSGVASSGRASVSQTDVSRLKPRQWLNDEIINFYGELIMSRSGSKENVKPAASGRPKVLDVFYFNTFFWSKLDSYANPKPGDRQPASNKTPYELARVSKWTKKVQCCVCRL